MSFVFEHAEMEKELAAAVTRETLEAVFQKITSFPRHLTSPPLYGKKLFSEGLDAIIPRVAFRLRLRDVPAEKSNKNVVVVATQFYAAGGHSRVAQDVTRMLSPDETPVILMTDIYPMARYVGLLSNPTLNSGIGERACVLLQSPDLVNKVLELYMVLSAMRPSRIILMCHPFDIVAILGCWPFRDVTEFMHHADHVPSLGAILPWSAHVDLTYTCHLTCKEHSGVDAVYAGMAVPPTPVRPPREPDPKRLRIATCGNIQKYRGKRRFDWNAYAVAVLRVPGTEIIHIGPHKEEDFEKRVRDALRIAGISQDRYTFTGPLANLPAALIEREVDVYLSSYPEPGGKANLEAMMADIPVIVPVDPGGPPLIHFRLPLPRYFEINSPVEMRAAIPRALALGATFNSPEQVAIKARELGRFDDYIAGKRPVDAPDLEEFERLTGQS